MDAFVDTLRLLPFLIAVYFILTYMEHKDALGFHRLLQRYTLLGPAAGALLGVIPQCGFSVMAACLYLDSSVSIGTLTAVFLATSDEAIPMLLAQPANMGTLWKLIIAKIVIGMLVGYAVDFLTRFHFHRHTSFDYETHDHDGGIWKETLFRTLSVGAYIFLFSLALNFVMESVSAQAISVFMQELGFLQPLLCALIGFIPNCASSVLLCELFTHGFISAGSLFCGLCCNAGLGFTILFRGHAWKTAGFVAGLLLVASWMASVLF